MRGGGDAPAGATRLHFLGVSTGQSAMRRIFPRWMAELGHPEVELHGVDLPLNAPAPDYRRAVVEIRDDPRSLGALITSHKIGVMEAAGDLFDERDRHARLCGELNGISKRGGRLVAHATDAPAAAGALDSFLGPDWSGGNRFDVLCFGAGGAATAIAIQFAEREGRRRPRRMALVDRVPARLERLERILAALPSGIAFEYHAHDDPRINDALLEGLPQASLVINATGMGKDLPGSPISDAARYRQATAVWELNYRGELRFLEQARAQAAGRGLRIEDGWVYFLHGWTKVFEQIWGVAIEGERWTRLRRIAEEERIPTHGQ